MNNKKVIIMSAIVGVTVIASVLLVINNNTSDDSNDNTTQQSTLFSTTVERDSDFNPNDSGNNNSQDVVTTPASDSGAGDVVQESGYRNGTYTESLDYLGGEDHAEKITVNITIENGVVTDVKNDHVSSHPKSTEYQGQFESVIRSEIVGDNIEGISLSRVGGASDTTNAFMNALENIKDDAKI